MDVIPLKRWGKRLMTKVTRFEMASIPEMVRHFPEVIDQMKYSLESEGICGETFRS